MDSLTLLYGHRHMHEVAAAEAQRAEMQSTPFAVVMVQLTALSLVNERDGHAAGDEAIREAARALQRAADRSGGCACRHGGRRLALIVPEVAEEGGSALARDLAVELNADGPGGDHRRRGLADGRHRRRRGGPRPPGAGAARHRHPAGRAEQLLSRPPLR